MQYYSSAYPSGEYFWNGLESAAEVYFEQSLIISVRSEQFVQYTVGFSVILSWCDTDFAKRLLLKKGAAPTILHLTANLQLMLLLTLNVFNGEKKSLKTILALG